MFSFTRDLDPSSPCRLEKYENTKVEGGTVDSGANSQSECEENCINSAICWGYDWTSTTQECRHLDSSNHTDRQVAGDGTIHVELTLCSARCKCSLINYFYTFDGSYAGVIFIVYILEVFKC